MASDEVTGSRPGPASSLTALWSARQQRTPHPGESRAGAEQLDEALRQRVALAGRAAEIDRPTHVIDLIGHPPTDITGRQRWRAAAGEIESYQARWMVDLTDGDHHEAIGEQAEHLRQVVGAMAAVDERRAPELAVELA